MTKTVKTYIRFDGDSLTENTIDIAVLSKSLLSLSALIKEANSLVKNDNTEINIKVNANVEQNCFELLLIFDTSWIDTAKSYLFQDDTVAVKELLEWLGIIAGATASVSGGLFWLIKQYKGKPLAKDAIVHQDSNNTTIKGDNNNITINNNVFKIYNDPQVRKYSQDFLSPLDNEGIDTIEFGDNKDKKSIQKITRIEAEEFLNYDVSKEVSSDKETGSNKTIKHIVVHKPTLDEDAKSWSFILDEKAVNIDISETSIAKDAIKRGDIRVGDTYKVKLEETEYRTTKGQYRIKYKIVEVIEFIRGDIQKDLFNHSNPKK